MIWVISLSLSLFSFFVLSFDILVILVFDLIELLHVLKEILAPFESDKQFGTLDETRLIVIFFGIPILFVIVSCEKTTVDVRQLTYLNVFIINVYKNRNRHE